MENKQSNKLLDFCFYYKGESKPSVLLTKEEGKLWIAEKMCTTEFQDNILSSNNIEREFKKFLIMYVLKWDFKSDSTIELYKKMSPDYVDEILLSL